MSTLNLTVSCFHLISFQPFFFFKKKKKLQYGSTDQNTFWIYTCTGLVKLLNVVKIKFILIQARGKLENGFIIIIII